jgi:xanthine dehydrogenase YagS FAD-binding subunit
MHAGSGRSTSSSFRYQRALSIADATTALSHAGAAPMGGGTDLLVSLDEGFVSTVHVVDLRQLPDGDTIVAQPDGSVRIGGAARIHDIAVHPLIAEHYEALAQACGSVGTPALRQMGTIGGNLCQRPRCWYLRRGVPCLKHGGTDCPARDGENQYHAILEGGPCYVVHPSDPAVALTALDARLEIAGGGTTRSVPIANFYVTPGERLDSETVLADGEFVRAVTLPATSAGGSQHYTKLMQRGSWDFALVSIAAVMRRDGAVRLVLGGVAPRPWRVPESLEEDAAAGALDADAIATIAERALYDAAPLSKNGYKVRLAETLIRRSIATLLAPSRPARSRHAPRES